MLKGIDLGNYSTKEDKGVNFLSKVSEYSNLEEKGDVLILNNKTYYLGEGDFNTEYRKAYRDNIEVLFWGMLALTSNSKFNKVVIGLPLSQYKEDKNYMLNRILQKNTQHLSINNMDKTLIVEDLCVVPEGVAALPGDFEGVVVDIGGRTTDICLMIKEGNRRNIEKPYSLPLGTLNLESDFISAINNKLGLDLLQRDSERILKNGLKIYGKEQNIDFAMDVYKDFVEKLIGQIQIDYPIKTFDVALVGGGANTLFTAINKRLPNSFLVQDSFLANAIGYYEIGKEVWL